MMYDSCDCKSVFVRKVGAFLVSIESEIQSTEHVYGVMHEVSK
jgi:hypothetical protein